MTLSRDYVQIIWGLHYHISLLTRISNYWTEYVFDIVNNGGRSWWASFISELTLLLPLSLYFLLTFTDSHPPQKYFICFNENQWKYRIAFAFWDIEQYVYCNCLFPRLRRHKFWNQPYLSYQAVFLHDQKVKTKIYNFQDF